MGEVIFFSAISILSSYLLYYRNVRLLTISQASVAALNVVQIVGSIYLSYRILTGPIISQSMNEFINYLLILPIAVCLGLADYLWWTSKYELPQNWIPAALVALGILQGILVRLLSSPLLISHPFPYLSSISSH